MFVVVAGIVSRSIPPVTRPRETLRTRPQVYVLTSATVAHTCGCSTIRGDRISSLGQLDAHTLFALLFLKAGVSLEDIPRSDPGELQYQLPRAATSRAKPRDRTKSAAPLLHHCRTIAAAAGTLDARRATCDANRSPFTLLQTTYPTTVRPPTPPPPPPLPPQTTYSTIVRRHFGAQ